MDAIQITTIEEVLYHLATKELVVFSMSDGEGYFEQKGNEMIICIQPKFGSATVYSGNRGMLRKTFKSFHDTEFYVIPGLTTNIKRVTLLDKIADFFRSK